jgi:hypothetical protein
MRYYKYLPAGPQVQDGRPDDYWSRLAVVEDDLKGIVSIARVEVS